MRVRCGGGACVAGSKLMVLLSSILVGLCELEQLAPLEVD